MRVLVVDDEAEMAALIERGLASEGHTVSVAANGIDALSLTLEQTFDVAVLDVMMPGMTGFEVCRWLKAKDPRMVVILLTARDQVDDRVYGLDQGADDYMIKPFAMAELSARIQAIHRRDVLAPPARISAGEIELDLFRHRAEVGGADLPLSRTEFDVLRTLASCHDEVVPRSLLLEEVWGSSDHIDPNVLDQYVSYLRRKLAAKRADMRIETIRGVGYRLTATSSTGRP